jgi:MFS family permease
MAPADLREKARAARGEIATSARIFGQVFRVPDLRRVELAFIGFNVTEWAAYIAILVYAFEQGGAAAAGLVSAAQLIPAAVFAPFGAILGDRYRRERMLLVAYVVQIATTGATAAALLLDAPLPIVVLLACIAAVGLTLVRPVHGSLLPALARSPSQLTAGYVADGMIESASVMLGPAVAAGIMAVSEPGMVYAATAGLLVVSLLLVARIETRTVAAPAASEAADVIEEALTGFRTLRDDRRSRLVVGLLGGGTFLLGILDVLMVSLAFDVFGSDAPGTGFLNAALGVGTLVGSVATVTLIARHRLHGAMRNGVFLCSLPIALVAAAPVESFTVAALVAAGAGMTLLDVTGRTMLQRLVPDASLSRVLGVLEGTYMASEGIGALLGAGLVAALGIEETALACGLLLPAILVLNRRRLASADVGTPVAAEDIRLLRSLPLFEGLGPPELERVARQVFTTRAAAREVVVAEGEVGDRFYVIKAGAVAVTKGDRRLATLASGDYFGEIALLRDVPRTATVTAETEAELLVLEREPFLEAVTPRSAGRRALDRTVDERLDAQRQP